MNGNNNKSDIVRGSPAPGVRAEKTVSATISNVYSETYSCDVRTDNGNDLTGLPLPGLKQDAVGSGGEVSIPRAGERVLVRLGGGERPRIIGHLPQSFDVGTSQNATPSLTEFDLPTTLSNRGQSSFRGNMPKGLLEGDWCRVGNQGQYIGVMDGGVSILHGSPWAHVRAVGGDTEDTLVIKGRRTDFRSDFGGIIFGSQEGKSWAEFYGGTDQTLETGADKQNYPVRADVGKTDGLVNWYVDSRDGQSMHRINIYPDGRTVTFQNGPREERVNGAYTGSFGDTCYRRVQQGSDIVEVQNGSRIENYFGNQDTTVLQNRSAQIYGNDSVIVDSNSYTQAATYDVQAQGSPLMTPADAAISMVAVNGSFAVDVAPTGNPVALPAAQSSFAVTVGVTGGGINLTTENPTPVVGDISLSSKAQMSLSSLQNMSLSTNMSFTQTSILSNEFTTNGITTINSTGPVTVNTPITLLSATGGAASDPAVLFIELLTYLNALSLSFDLHTHPIILPVPGTPTAPPLPVAPFALLTNALAPTFMSKKVLLGG